MGSFRKYISSFFSGLGSLLVGMKITGRSFLRRKVTEQYPENRDTLRMFDRFRGTLELVHNENNEHRCVACGICQMNCPNHTIEITSNTVTTEDGKSRKVLDAYQYDLGSCTFCQLCVSSCPHDALAFSTEFEHAVFTRSKLVKQLNHPGSTVVNK